MDNKKEYVSLQGAMFDQGSKIPIGNQLHPDPTANAAIRHVDSQRERALKAEIEAVEEAVSFLTPEQREVIRRRFWDNQRGGTRKPRQYDFLQDIGYSEVQMKRICRTVIRRIAVLLGER
jgi:hypothetical protein